MPRRRVDLVPDGPVVGALELCTEVPTPSGTTALSALHVGDTVFGSCGRPVLVTELSEPLPDQECLEVELSTGDRIVADVDQRWLTDRRDLPRSALLPTRRPTLEVAGSVAELGPAVLGIRVAPAVRLPDRALPLDPYLLGAWLAAGIAGGPSLTGVAPAVVARLRVRGARAFPASHDLGGVRHWIAVPVGSGRRAGDLAARLRRLEVLDDKHLPTGYLRAGEEQRRDLLAGLLDARGRVTDGGEVVLHAPTHAVAAGAYELLASLGYRPALRVSRTGAVEVGFVTADPVFGLEPLRALHQSRRRLSADPRPRRLVVGVRRVGPRTVRRIRVGADDGVLLVGRSFVPMPGAAVAEFRVAAPA